MIRGKALRAPNPSLARVCSKVPRLCTLAAFDFGTLKTFASMGVFYATVRIIVLRNA
jgi:hypothetical protein